MLAVPEKIISGGQTGADRAALDWALRKGVLCGGWCPKGRQAEDGVIDGRYPLKETPERDYAQRTEWNVRDSDGTVVFTLQPVLTGGTLLTVEFACALARPWLHLCQADIGRDHTLNLRQFVAQNRIFWLNVAGPRDSETPGIGAFVTAMLETSFPQRDA